VRLDDTNGLIGVNVFFFFGIDKTQRKKNNTITTPVRIKINI
jgi:hypothetical protein